MTKLQIIVAGIFTVFLIFSLLLPNAFAADAWCALATCDNNWALRKKITIQNDQVSGTSHSDFAVLMSLSNDTDLKSSNVQSAGEDIRFTNEDGSAVLSYEIESFSNDGTDGSLVAWVKIPTLSATTDTILYMYYGNSGASSTANAGLVWDSNYVSVWHLNNDFLDSAGSNDATNNGSTDITGKIADGQSFDGNDYVDAGTGASLDVTSTFTLEAWIKPDVITGYTTIMNKRSTSGNYPFVLLLNEGKLNLFVSGGGTPSNNVISVNQFQHIAVTRSGENINFYVNGDAQGSSTNAPLGTSDTNADFLIGATTDGTVQLFYDGIIDEVKVSSTVRSADFIKTEYNNQNSPSTFYSVGSEEGFTTNPIFTADRTGLNTIVLTFSENVDTTTLDGSGYTLSTGTVSSNSDPAGSSNIMTLTTSGISGTSATPTVTYTQAAGTTVDGGANEVENNFNTVATDSIAPTFTADRVGLNAIVLIFSENVDTTTTDGSGYTLSTGTVSSNSDPSGSGNTMKLTTSGISGTSTVSVTYTQAAGTTVDGGANEVENNFNTVATDRTAPTFTADRTDVNTIVLTFSENVSGASIANSFTVSGASSVTNTAPFNSPTVTLTTVGLTAIDSSLLVTYVAATGNIADQASNEVANGENANTPYTAPPGAWCNTAKCDSTWQYRKLITIDYTKVGTDNNSGYITDFPFLVTFTGSDFAEVEDNTQSSGADIRFIDQQGNDLEYEIEEYDEVANKMTIWVKSNSPGIAKHENTLVYMYYGNSGASSTANAGLVWDSNYKAVYHLNDDFLDSTSNDNDAVNSGSTDIIGQISDAQDFDGTNDGVDATIGSANSLDVVDFTLEAWVNPDTLSSFTRVVTTTNQEYSMLFYNNKLNFIISGGGYNNPSYTTVSTNEWTHVAVTFSNPNDKIKFYINGVLDANDYDTFSAVNPNIPGLKIGNILNQQWFDGTIDEVRVSNTVRSADFIKTEYNNQNSPSTFYSISSEDIPPPPTLTITTIPTTPSSTKISLVYTFQFSEDVTGFTSADITLNFAGAGASAVAGSNFATTDANTYTLTLAGQDLTDLGTLTNGQTIVASVDMTGLTSTSTAGVGAEQNTWTYNTGPTTPPLLTANQGNAQISLTWTPSTSGVGSITDYIIEYKQSSSGTWLTFNDGTSTSTSATMAGLANDVSYDFRVSAESSGVSGSTSSPVTIAPAVTATKAAQSFSTSSNILFDDVTVAVTGSGSITVEKLNSNPEASAPSETIVGSFYDITSSGTLSDRTVIMSYSDTDVAGLDELSLKINRFSGGTWSVLTTIVNPDANTATATTPGFSTFVLGSSSGSSGMISDIIKPSFSRPFYENEYPISIGNNKFKLKDLGFAVPTTIIETGKPVLVTIMAYENSGSSNISHVKLFTNFNGLLMTPDTYIIYTRGHPLEIVDKNGFFSNVSFGSAQVNQKLQVTFEITFAKEMELSDIIVHVRDTANNVGILKVIDAWQIIQDPATVEKAETIIIELTDVSVPDDIEVKTLKAEKPAYVMNEEILFSGTVDDERFDSIVSIMINDPSDSLQTIIYAFPDPEGYFETTLNADSKFKTDGEYTALAYTDVVNKGLKTTFYFSHDVRPDITTTFGGAMQFEPLKQVEIEAGTTSAWTSIPGFVADDIDDLHIWYDISGQVASWISPQKLDFGVASDEKVFPELSWSITVPKNTSPGFYTFEWIEQCETMTDISCVSKDLQFRIQVVPTTSDPLLETISFLIIIVIAIGIFVGSFFILGKKMNPTQTSKQ